MADKETLRKYREKLGDEIESICRQILRFLTNHLCKKGMCSIYNNIFLCVCFIVEGDGNEIEVFYMKMCGDYFRYWREFVPSAVFDGVNAGKKAKEYYRKAMDIAEKIFNAVHPRLLEVAFNFSVCLYISGEKEAAIGLAKRKFDAALENLDGFNNFNYRDSTRIMQLLRDNLAIWTEDDDNDGIDIYKYAQPVKATKHNPDDEQAMHDMKADMKKLGLMPQNTEEPSNPMDKVRDNLRDLIAEISDDGENGGLYAVVVDLILEYEAFIDLSPIKCFFCQEYFGCDVFHGFCSECYQQQFDEATRKKQCKENMEDIVVKLNWIDRHSIITKECMINMPSLCSVKIMFRILNRNNYRGEYLEVLDGKENYQLEKSDYLEKDDEVSDAEKEKRKRNERCITDFGVNQLSAILLRS